jgi:acyl carrier protein
MIGCDDSFFHLGGDSVSAISLVAVAREFGVSLSVTDIFTYPTMSEMANAAVKVNEDEEEPVLDVTPFAMVDEDGDKDDMIKKVTDMFDF